MASECAIPVVDFSLFNVDLADEDVEQSDMENISTQIHEAFSTVGFVYLKNCGISDVQVTC